MTAGKEKWAELLFRATGFISVAALLLIAVFILSEGWPALAHVGVWRFLTGYRWAPGKDVYGVFPMIAGSFAVTLGALLVGVPVGLGAAIYLSEFAPERAAAMLKFAVELLAGIPSVVYGFAGLTILVPLIRDRLGGPGFSVLAASLVVGVMILPTVTSVSYDSLKAAPDSYREGILALGATPWQAVSMVVLPAARSGVFAGIVLGMGRAIGETLAIIMVAGNAAIVPVSPLDPVRTLTSNIALEMGYATGLHRQALFATGVVLFVIIALLNLVARKIVRSL